VPIWLVAEYDSYLSALHTVAFHCFGGAQVRVSWRDITHVIIPQMATRACRKYIHRFITRYSGVDNLCGFCVAVHAAVDQCAVVDFVDFSTRHVLSVDELTKNQEGQS
jgi:hypothetical protein